MWKRLIFPLCSQASAWAVIADPCEEMAGSHASHALLIVRMDGDSVLSALS